MDIIIFVIALSVLVLVHEFGHFFAAKAVGVKVEEFGLGLPPKIIGRKKWGTIWSLNWLPIGGFCKLEGENPSDEAVKSKTSFMYKNPAQKALVVLGGVLMNMVLAVAIFAVVYTILGVPRTTEQVKVLAVAKDSPAFVQEIKEGDWVSKVNGIVVKKPDELTAEVSKYKGKSVELEIVRGDLKLSLPIEVRENPPKGEGSMGITISNTEMEKIKWYEFYKGIGAGFKEAYFWGKIIADGVFKMIGGVVTGHLPKDVSGPIGMYEATSSIKKNQGILAMVHFFGIVSVNLAVVNVLPFPALDGGRIIFVIYEMITRKRANERFENTVNTVGMLVLLGLILLITVGDVWRLFK
ncbi:site-2 protease family protein [Candidatus Shapirobacteria bacterium]|nr:site-2 protease family protein [Candidatus Shapirobacteria bacterium]